jgi:hypothetical protein
MRTLASLDSRIGSLVVSRDGSTLIAAQDDGVGFVDLASGQHHVRPVGDGVRRLALGPDGLLAGTASGEIWTVTARPERLIEAIDDDISGLAVAANGTIAVCGGDPFAVATFGRYGNEEWRGEPSKWPYCVRVSDDGTLLAMASWDGHLFVFDTTDLPDEIGDPDVEYAGGPIFDAQFLPGGDVVVAGARFVRVWDRASGSYMHARELAAEALAIAVTPDARCAVVSTNDQRLRLLRLPDLEDLGQLVTGHEPAELRGGFPDYAEYCRVKGGATVRALAMHPDGARVFAGTEDGRLVEVSLAALEAHAAPRVAATPAPAQADAVDVASADADDDVAAGEPIETAAADELPADELSADELPADELPATEPPTPRAAAQRVRARPAKKPSANGSRATRTAASKRAANKLSASKRGATKPAAQRARKKAAHRLSGKAPASNGARGSKASANPLSAKKPTRQASAHKSASRPIAGKVAGARRSSKKAQPRR